MILGNQAAFRSSGCCIWMRKTPEPNSTSTAEIDATTTCTTISTALGTARFGQASHR